MKLDFSKESREELLARIRKDTVMETSAEITPDTEPDYFFEVQGFVPEFVDGVAFRRARRPERRLKEVKCPHCSGVFEIVDEQTKIEVHRNPQINSAPCHSYKLCRTCRRKVGIKFTAI